MTSASSIIFFQRGEVFGGAEESLAFNARACMAEGGAVTILCLRDGPVAERFAEKGFRVERLLPTQRSKGLADRLAGRIKLSMECRLKGLSRPTCLRAAERVTSRESAALRSSLVGRSRSTFCANMSVAGDFQFLRLAAGLGYRTVSHQRVTPPPWTGRPLIAEVNDFCTEIVSNSIWTRNQWIEQGLRRARHHAIYNSIPFSPPAPDSLRGRLSLPSDAKLLGSAGRLESTKEFERGLAAFLRIADEFPDWHYVVIGDGSSRGALGRQANASPHRDRVHFPGEIRDAASYFSQMDLFFHPTPAEHFGRVVAEAMVQGTLVVAHASGGVTEMITHGETGLLFTTAGSMLETLRLGMQRYTDLSLRRSARNRISLMCGSEARRQLISVLFGHDVSDVGAELVDIP